MSVTNTTVLSATNKKIIDVKATSDSDTTATIAHGMSAAPKSVTLLPLDPAFYVSAWTAAIDTTNVVLTKTTGAGSGASGNQVRCEIALPHSISE